MARAACAGLRCAPCAPDASGPGRYTGDVTPPFFLTPPMLATPVRQPFHRDGWVYEEKVDGFRMLAVKLDGDVQIISRRGVDHTRRYPDLAKAVAALPQRTIILDGEVAVFDQQLRSRWDWLRGAPKDVVATPPVLVAFDCLLAGERDLRPLPLRERRDVLELALERADLILPARRLAPHGLKAWQEVVDHEYEGLVAKDGGAPYVGGRTLHWLKVLRPESRAVIAKRFGRE